MSGQIERAVAADGLADGAQAQLGDVRRGHGAARRVARAAQLASQPPQPSQPPLPAPAVSRLLLLLPRDTLYTSRHYLPTPMGIVVGRDRRPPLATNLTHIAC